MFDDSTKFDQNLDNWNVSKVEQMQQMFARSNFNKNLVNWDVSNVKNMKSMFYNNQKFNQDISGWDVCKTIRSNQFDTGTSSNWADSDKPEFGPCVLKIESSNSDGFYKEGDSISIKVYYSQDINYDNSQTKLTLDFVKQDKEVPVASYSKMSETSGVLTFDYTIKKEDISRRLKISKLPTSTSGKVESKNSLSKMPSFNKTLEGQKKIIVIGDGKSHISVWDTSKTTGGSTNLKNDKATAFKQWRL